MAYPPYSHRLFMDVVATTSAYVPLYTVPSDKTLILRRCTAVNFNSGPAQAIFGTVSGFQLLKPPAVASGVGLDLDTWLVYPGGDQVAFYSFLGPWEVSIHGQLLSAV